MSIRDIIQDAIQNFPNIESEFGFERILSIDKENEYSPLIYHLKKSIIDESKINNAIEKLKEEPDHIGVLLWLDMYLDSYYVMKDLDTYIKDLKVLDGFKSIIEHLINSFWQGYAELEIAYYLKKIFGEIELEPKLPNGKFVDVAYVTKEKYYVEVIAPRRYYKTERAIEKSGKEGIVVELPDSTDRACEKIIAELTHFEDIIDEVKSLLIIDLKHTDFTEIEIEDCLLGVSKLVIMKNAETGRYVGTRVEREKWTGFDYDDRLSKLGAVICFNKEKNLYGTPVFDKKVFQINFDDDEIKPLLTLFNE